MCEPREGIDVVLMPHVRLTTDLLRVDGGMFRAGSVFTVLREFRANGHMERNSRRLCLGYEDGTVVLPCVDPEAVEEVGRTIPHTPADRQ